LRRRADWQHQGRAALIGSIRVEQLNRRRVCPLNGKSHFSFQLQVHRDAEPLEKVVVAQQGQKLLL